MITSSRMKFFCSSIYNKWLWNVSVGFWHEKNYDEQSEESFFSWRNPTDNSLYTILCLKKSLSTIIDKNPKRPLYKTALHGGSCSLIRQDVWLNCKLRRFASLIPNCSSNPKRKTQTWRFARLISKFVD